MGQTITPTETGLNVTSEVLTVPETLLIELIPIDGIKVGINQLGHRLQDYQPL
ncbi:hypothetical protein FHK94_11605 [Cylindrospermopsis raciborskii CS-506_D]|nr:hypothetical protein [Cylindrospermopsis raciborskii]MBA4450215.1 hypothetical protein [Cylindrospermopsis raciborskii CS-506_D]